jgi:hypothetical protein
MSDEDAAREIRALLDEALDLAVEHGFGDHARELRRLKTISFYLLTRRAYSG